MKKTMKTVYALKLNYEQSRTGLGIVSKDPKKHFGCVGWGWRGKHFGAEEGVEMFCEKAKTFIEDHFATF